MASFARNAIVLGLLTAVGPFAIDMYLPALPQIGVELNAEPGVVQLSVLAFFAAVGLCQTVYGPLSDMFGRRRPLFAGMILYAIGGIGCALAPTVEMLIAMRFLQGIGACAGMTIPRAVVRDLHTGPDAARLMSLVMLVFSVSPMLAPLFGSVVTEFASWRAIFWALAGLGVLGLVLAATSLPETRPAEARIASSWGSVFTSYGRLLVDRYFLGVSFIGGFGMAAFFSYLTGASFLFIDHFGLSPMGFSAIFASNAFAFIGTAQLNGWLGKRFGLARVVLAAASAFACFTLLLLGLTLVGGESLVVLWIMLFISFGSLGLVVPSTLVLALDNYGRIAGTASSLLGTLQMLLGAGVTALVTIFADGSPLPMVAAIAGCGVLAATLAWATLGPRSGHGRGGRTVPAPAE